MSRSDEVLLDLGVDVGQLGRGSGEAAVSDQITEQLDLAVAHRLLTEDRQASGHSDGVADGQRAERLPAIDGQERMRRCGLDHTPQSGCDPKHRFQSIINKIARLGRGEAQTLIQCQQRCLALPHDRFDGCDPAIGEQDLAAGFQALTHRRPPRADDQVGGLQAGGLHVEVDEAGRQAGDGFVAMIEFIDLIDRDGEEFFDRLEAAATGELLGDLEHLGLGGVEDLGLAAALGVEGQIGDAGAGADQLAQHRVEADDARIVRGVGGRAGVAVDLGQIGHAAHVIEQLALVERLGQRDDVERVVLIGQDLDGAEDQLMFLAIKIGLAHPIRDLLPDAVLQHQGAEQ